MLLEREEKCQPGEKRKRRKLGKNINSKLLHKVNNRSLTRANTGVEDDTGLDLLTFREGTSVVREHGKENRSRLVTARSALVIANERLADIGATERRNRLVTRSRISAGDDALLLAFVIARTVANYISRSTENSTLPVG